MNLVIGELIKSVAARRGITKSEMARRLNMSPTNIHKIFKRQSIDTALLTRIGDLLQYDFFIHFVKTTPADYNERIKDLGFPVVLSKEAEVTYNAADLDNCKERVRMLEKINSLLEDKISFISKS